MDLEFGVVDNGYQGAGVGRVVLGFVDETASLVVDVAVRQRPGVLLTPPEGQETLHLAAGRAHEGLELLGI